MSKLFKNAVFLFGSGAILDWQGPSTSELTKIVLESGFKVVDDSKTVTQAIYDQLTDNGFKDSDINFETIINVIEELLVIYSDFDSHSNLPSLLRCFVTPNITDDIMNFSLPDGRKHSFTLQIPKGVKYDFSHYALHNETPEQFYLQHLLTDILSNINARISKYSYHTEGHSEINMDNEVSKNFVTWMKGINQTHNLRLYTLNYDRVFKVLLESNGIKIFEGFNSGEFVGYYDKLRANVCKILNDSSSNIHYNLHGSAYWEVLDLDKELLPNPEIVLTSLPNLHVDCPPASFQVEKGKTLLVTNIITGYQKAQKGMITPFKQMQSAFDRDCCSCDTLFVVGYSFGDEHINESIKTAIRHNPDIKIQIVDPNFINKNMDEQLALRFFPFKDKITFNYKRIKDNGNSFFDGDFIAYHQYYHEFLEVRVKFPWGNLNPDIF